MTRWHIINTSPPRRRKPIFLVTKTVAGKTYSLGEKGGHVQGILVDIIDHIKPGDVVTTPEGHYTYQVPQRMLPQN